ncbi:hypothetical protein QCA50_013267 [Cerrena zonata]|uniref:Uncharacterized protein n=1 Tax=Cerrena zonata TaxID=2478898 RepID=A0AAW0FRN4_9APHY
MMLSDEDVAAQPHNVTDNPPPGNLTSELLDLPPPVALGAPSSAVDAPATDTLMASEKPAMDQKSSFGEGPSDRPLFITDALAYLDSVRLQFKDRPKVCKHFFDVMKDFKRQRIDIMDVIERVSNLFHGHPSLIQGFNTFMPPGYQVECTDNLNFIIVTTPTGRTTQATSDRFH